MDSTSRSSADQYESPEESSWTMYFEDFSNQNTIDHMNQSTSSINLSHHINHQTSSLIPDAACSAAGRHVLRTCSDDNKSKSLSFKKRKTKRSSSSYGFVDHDLEDTATSPANSPKVYNMVNHFDKQKGAMGMSQENKGNASGKINDDELNFNGGENVGNELKKKGLCLVPLSMVVHYLG